MSAAAARSAIGEWLITLFAFAAPIPGAAENAVSAMFYGLRSADLDFSEGMPADTGARARASEDAVRTAANAPDFPAGQLVRDAVRRNAGQPGGSGHPRRSAMSPAACYFG